MKKIDYIFIIIPLIIALGLLILQKQATEISIYVDNNLIHILSLSQDQTLEIPSPSGFNVILIENGTARVIEANCPNKTCVKTPPIKDGVIACIPHKLLIQSGSPKNQVDAISY